MADDNRQCRQIYRGTLAVLFQVERLELYW